jgi:hypothetical protein
MCGLAAGHQGRHTTTGAFMASALTEAGRPDLLCVVIERMNGTSMLFDWDQLGRLPTEEEVRIVSTASGLWCQLAGKADRQRATWEEWHAMIVAAAQ